MLTFGSAFSGIGGLDLGLEWAGWKCRWQIELDDYCRRVLAKHWPVDVPKFSDIREMSGEELSQVDMIAAGFPCQDLSVAGKREGIHAKRSGLFFDLMRIVRMVRPRYLLLENVPGLLSRTEWMGAVLEELAASGYDAEWYCLPAAVFGAHFIGYRVFIISTSSKASKLRRERKWSRPSRTDFWGRAQFERLVEYELSVCVSAGKNNRISDGLPKRMDRLRGLGNAVVPQVAEWIGRRLIESISKKELAPGR